MSSGEALLLFVTGLALTLVATKAAIHNFRLWRGADKRAPLITQASTAHLAPVWPVADKRARQWPQPSEQAQDESHPAYWAAYARLAEQEAQRKRLYAQGGLVLAGSWLGVRIEPFLRDVIDTAKGESPRQSSIPLFGDTWPDALLNLSPLLLLMFFVVLLKWADDLESMRQAYTRAATPRTPRSGSPERTTTLLDGAVPIAPATVDRSRVGVLLLGSAIGLAIGLLRPARRTDVRTAHDVSGSDGPAGRKC